MFKISIMIGWICAGGLVVCTVVHLVRNFSSPQKAEQFAAEIKRREKSRNVPIPEHYIKRTVESTVEQLSKKPKSHATKQSRSRAREMMDFAMQEMKRIQLEVAGLVGTSEGDDLVPGCKLELVNGKPYFSFPQAAKIKVGHWTIGERPSLRGVIYSGSSNTNIYTGCCRGIDDRILKDEPIYHCMNVHSGILTSSEQLYYLNLSGKIMNANDEGMLALMDETEESFIANYDSVSVVKERSVNTDGASEELLINGCIESSIRWYKSDSENRFQVTFRYSPAHNLAEEESQAIAEALTEAGFTSKDCK